MSQIRQSWEHLNSSNQSIKEGFYIRVVNENLASFNAQCKLLDLEHSSLISSNISSSSVSDNDEILSASNCKRRRKNYVTNI